MTSKRISVVLNSYAYDVLTETMKINECNISDVINAAVVSFGHDKQPVIEKRVDVLEPVRTKLSTTQWKSVDNWCNERGIKKTRLMYLLRSIQNGSTVSGFGNTINKWRDKQDDRLYKTHTAWIAYCLKTDLGIDVI